MKKILSLMLTLLMCAVIAAAAWAQSTPQPEGDDMTTGGFNPDRLRTGGQVSEAFVDPDSIETISPEHIKATGFDYDEARLSYDLVWSDEFDVDGPPDPEKWDYDTGGHGWGNNELQYYTRGGNVKVENGLLVLEARQEQMGGRDYTSTRMVTRKKGDWLYGKFEIRAKLPKGLGTWPAIWMLPTDWVYGGWPASGEIDIMEHVGYDQGRLHASVHTQTFHHSIGTQKTATIQVPDISEAFHTYTLTWLPDKIEIGMDDQVYYTYRPTQYVAQPTFREWPFDQRHHLLINIAFGGNWGGARGIDAGMLPQQMLVDYVRVYQSPEINALVEKEQDK